MPEILDLGDGDQVECRADVKLDIVRVAGGHGHQLWDVGEGVGILGGQSVYRAIVNHPPALVPTFSTRAPQLVAREAGLVDEERPCCGGGGGRLDPRSASRAGGSPLRGLGGRAGRGGLAGEGGCRWW